MALAERGKMRWGRGDSMRNPWAWLVSRFAQKAVPIACGTPHVWAEEQQQAAEWARADQDPSYGLSDGGKFYSKDEARGLIAEWRKAKEPSR